MEYERVHKSHHHQSGGLSPGKLKSMLLGVEKKRKEEKLQSCYAMESHSDQAGDCFSDNCKDVDVVCEVPECSTSNAVDSVAACGASEYRSKDHSYTNSRIKPQDNLSLDCDSIHDVVALPASIFEFQKAERASQRVSLAPFSKPAPSKWDDAHKWIASPTWNRPKTGQTHALVGQGGGSRKMGSGGYLTRQPSMKAVMEVSDKKIVAAQEPDTKWVDTDQTKKETGVQKFLPWEADSLPASDSCGKSVLMIENSVGRPTISLSQHGSTIAVHSTTAFIPAPSTARSVSMRDMGTEMTPIASQEPSRTGTPVRATTPSRSPTSSVPSSPTGATQSSSPLSNPFSDHLSSNKGLSEKELQMKTRKEIMMLGTKLGKMNIAAWASKEEEDKDASTSLKTVVTEKSTKSVIETRAAAWEEAEKAKYMARFKREEMKIQAWENHEKAKTEAEMRKIEVEVERIRGRAQDKLMNKLAAARHKAEEKRAAAESKRNQHAAKTEHQADYIRKTGRIPSTFSLCGWCF